MKILQHTIWILLISSALLATCGAPPAPAEPNAMIPSTVSATGDVNRGKAIYTSQGCVMCHTTTTQALVGPGLAGVMTAGGPDYPKNVDYGYALPNGAPRTEENIAAWILKGGRGQIAMMPARRLNEQEMADILAYLRTLEK